MSWFRVDPSAPTPPSQQIVEAVLDAVAAGRFDGDGKLPSVRSLAVEVLVNPNTVSKAYTELERLGVTRSRNGSGVFVTDEGTQLARDLRQTATLSDFADAARSALRSGHDLDTLVSILSGCSTDLGVATGTGMGERQ